VGSNKFILEVDPPNPSSIPHHELLGVTVVLVSCSYLDQVFAQVGFYVNNEYVPFEGYDEEIHGVPPILSLDYSKVVRTILADKPRVTRFPINWSGGDRNVHGVPEHVSVDTSESSMIRMEWNDVGNELKETFYDSGEWLMSPARTSSSMGFEKPNAVSPDVSQEEDAITVGM